MNNRMLNDADLDAVSGGQPMSCAGAVSMANLYMSLSTVHYALGDDAGGAKFGGKSVSILHNICGTGGK